MIFGQSVQYKTTLNRHLWINELSTNRVLVCERV